MDNPEGSQERRLLKKLKIMNEKKKLHRKGSYKNLKITREIRDIIHGYIMSDGYVNKTGYLAIEQSKKQLKFVEWLYQKFKDLRTETRIREISRTDKRTNTQTFSAKFQTKSLLHGYHSMWYKLVTTSDPATGKDKIAYKKVLPKSIACFFSPTFIALWFAGDGTRTLGSKGAKFEVTNYSPKDRLKLQALFKKKYDIEASIIRVGVSKSGTEQWSISILSKDYDKFKKIITQIDLIPTLFPNKLH